MRLFAPILMLALSAAPAQSCDVALVLAIDVSGSIDAGEYRIQSTGTANALRDPAVTEALLAGRTALSVLHWSSVGQQALVLPWTRMHTPADIARAADAVQQAPRTFVRSDTAVGDAVDAAVALFEAVPDCARRIIDISGDGQENKGGPVRDARARAIAAGVAINAIAIEDLGQSTAITRFYRDWVITRGGFVITSRGLGAYPAAIRAKLLRELEKPAS